MANKTYVYPIASFPNGTVDTTLLTQEIEASAISTPLVNVLVQGDDCLTTFEDTLTTVEYGIFANILNTHQGTQTTYTYSISTDFPTGAVNLDQLWGEIVASTIVGEVVGVNAVGDDCNIIFKAPLSGADKTTLDGLVAVHTPIKLIYAYSISEDFPNQKVDAEALGMQVESSSITTPLSGVNTKGDVCNIVFESQLSAPEVVVLDTVVANHDGEPIVYTTNAYAESARYVTSSVTVWTQKLRLTLPNCRAGDYRIGWSYSWATSNADSSIGVQVQLDDTVTLGTYSMTNKPALMVQKLNGIPATAYPNLSDGVGFARITLSEGAHFIDIDYKASNASFAVKIGDVKIEAVAIDVGGLI